MQLVICLIAVVLAVPFLYVWVTQDVLDAAQTVIVVQVKNVVLVHVKLEIVVLILVALVEKLVKVIVVLVPPVN